MRGSTKGLETSPQGQRESVPPAPVHGPDSAGAMVCWGQREEALGVGWGSPGTVTSVNARQTPAGTQGTVSHWDSVQSHWLGGPSPAYTPDSTNALAKQIFCLGALT